MSITAVIKASLNGILVALLLWCIGMFVYGEPYSFMQGTAGEYDAADVTRVFMSAGFIIGFGVTCLCSDADDDE